MTLPSSRKGDGPWQSHGGCVRNFTRYQISTDGRVRIEDDRERWGGWAGKPLRVQSDRTGRRYVVLVRYARGGNRRVNRDVAEMILEAFRGPARGRVPVFKNGDLGDARLGNLKWGTPQDARRSLRRAKEAKAAVRPVHRLPAQRGRAATAA